MNWYLGIAVFVWVVAAVGFGTCYPKPETESDTELLSVGFLAAVFGAALGLSLAAHARCARCGAPAERAQEAHPAAGTATGRREGTVDSLVTRRLP